ncbi:UNVERIFIED_ORG: hypothetical protein GGD48_004831 [Rhizobium etli]
MCGGRRSLFMSVVRSVRIASTGVGSIFRLLCHRAYGEPVNAPLTDDRGLTPIRRWTGTCRLTVPIPCSLSAACGQDVAPQLLTLRSTISRLFSRATRNRGSRRFSMQRSCRPQWSSKRPTRNSANLAARRGQAVVRHLRWPDFNGLARLVTTNDRWVHSARACDQFPASTRQCLSSAPNGEVEDERFETLKRCRVSALSRPYTRSGQPRAGFPSLEYRSSAPRMPDPDSLVEGTAVSSNPETNDISEI